MKDDSISRRGTSAWLENMGYPNLAKMIMDEKRFPSAQPYTIHSDGRLWVTVDDIDKVNAVVVDESKSKFCKQFYMDAQPEPLTDKEQRIFLAAIERERKVCKEVDDQYVHEPYEVLLTKVCDEIKRKVKKVLWT